MTRASDLFFPGNPHWTPSAGFSSRIKRFPPEDLANMRLAVPLRPGDAVVHHANTIHAGRPNMTVDRWRRAVALILYR